MVAATKSAKKKYYDDVAGRAAISGRTASEEARDIGLPVECSDPQLRALVEQDLEQFLLQLWPKVFKWPFSDDQRLSIQQMDSVITRGGLQAIADPRGTGKTQRAIRAALKAILTGKRKYVCIVASTEAAARRIIRAINKIVCFHRRLQKLFPAELHGFRELQGTNRKAPGMLCNGQPTGIGLKAGMIVFPTIPGSKSNGAIITACGITGSLRGQFEPAQNEDDEDDGDVLRPDLVLVDDPQTHESATSTPQTNELMEIIEGDILGLADPDTPIACIVLCTVIKKNDLSERILVDPRWHGRRTKTIYDWPTDLKAWDKYFEDYDEAIRIDQPERINEMYLERRDELDAGCKLAWDHRIEAGDVSAIQTAMHIWHRVKPNAFGAEFQNEPLVDASDLSKPSAIALAEKLIHLPRGTVPNWATRLTAAIDCQQTCLYWMVVAWSDDFTGHIVSYGVYPEQPRSYFILREVSPTLQQQSGSSQVEGALRWGLDKLAEHLCGPWPQEGGGIMRVAKLLVDAGKWPDTIHEFAARSAYGATILPCLGQGITAAKVPMERWAARANETLGWHWAIRKDRRATPHGLLDTYFWKTFFCERIAALAGERGSMSIFGEKPEQHRLLFDHLSSEVPIKTEGQGRSLWEWRKIGSQDNHWLDCLASNCAAGSMDGCGLPNAMPTKTERRVFKIPGRA